MVWTQRVDPFQAIDTRLRTLIAAMLGCEVTKDCLPRMFQMQLERDRLLGQRYQLQQATRSQMPAA